MRGAYLDHAAASPLDERVVAAMRPWIGAAANPSALHDAGRRAWEAVERARAQLAELVGAAPDEVILTAGAVEARNLAVKGLLAGNRRLGADVVASPLEHPATLAAARTATAGGGELRLVAVDGEGRIAPEEVAAAVGEATALVSLHHGQGDIGTLQHVEALVGAARRSRPEARVHVDAGETAGLVPVDLPRWGADAVSLGGTSIGGPAHTGALVVREGARLRPLIEGGVEEGGKRGGPPDVAGTVGLGAAAALAAAEMATRTARMRRLTERLVAGLLAVPDVRLDGPREGRIPGNVHVATGWAEGESLALALAARGVAVSPGSACTAHAGTAAPVLEAIGLEPPWTHSAVLFTLRATTTEAEVDHAAAAFADAVAALRAMSPLAGAGR